jgi:hypothetical protein
VSGQKGCLYVRRRHISISGMHTFLGCTLASYGIRRGGCAVTRCIEISKHVAGFGASCPSDAPGRPDRCTVNCAAVYKLSQWLQMCSSKVPFCATRACPAALLPGWRMKIFATRPCDEAAGALGVYPLAYISFHYWLFKPHELLRAPHREAEASYRRIPHHRSFLRKHLSSHRSLRPIVIRPHSQSSPSQQLDPALSDDSQ